MESDYKFCIEGKLFIGYLAFEIILMPLASKCDSIAPP